MTQAAKLKTVIRARVAKTGESYTTARRRVLATRPLLQKPAVIPFQPPPPIPAAARDPRVPRGELSNKSSIKSTGHDLEHWFKVLDTFGKKQGHTKTAEYLYTEHKIQAWHAQMITVTWERARGLRQENQSCTGTFQVSVSRSIAAPVDWMVDLINHPQMRASWLEVASPALRLAMEEAFASGKSLELKKNGYARLRYKWLSSVVELRITAMTGGKSAVVADNSGLPDAATVALRRTDFSLALDRLREMATH